MPPIKNNSILVIGGSSGIGFAVAKLAAQEGARVFIASSNPDRVANAVSRLKEVAPDAPYIAGYTCDIGGDNAEANLHNLFKEATAASGSLLDHIVYTAVKLDLKPVSEVTVPYLRQNLQFAHVVPLLISKLAPSFMKERYTSSMTFTSGMIAEKPVKGYTVVCGGAAGLAGLTRALALDLAPIRVNLVSPGLTITELMGSEEQRAQVAEMASKTALLGKPGMPEEVAEAYVYLMKDSNNTGTNVNTNGGALLQ